LNKKFGLGKGLGALIPEDMNNDKTEVYNNVNRIPINLIKANERQPRRNFDEESLQQLTASIKEHGIIQPIVLQNDGSTYTIIAGERRWRAAKMAGIKDVPAVIMDVTEKQVLEISLIENIQREDLNPIEEAEAYTRLINDFNITQEELAEKIGKSRVTVTNCMRLLNLDERVKEYLIDGIISEGHGRAILGVGDNDLQYKISQVVIDENLSVRETENLIKSYGKKNNKKNDTKDMNPFYADIKGRLEGYFGTKVSIKSKKNRGKIEIEYYSEEDLQRIIDIININ
jgi:ParB family transcriptional regulator, chromosome partitioning protein